MECVLKHARRAYQLNPKCKHKWFAIPAGSACNDKAPEESLIKRNSKNEPLKKLKYKQKERGLCFGYSFANAMYHLGYKGDSQCVADQAVNWSQQDNDNQLNKLSWFLCSKLKIAIPAKKENELSNLNIKNFIKKVNNHDIVVVIPQGMMEALTMLSQWRIT